MGEPGVLMDVSTRRRGPLMPQDKDTERGQSSAEALSTSVRLGGIFSSLSCWP